MLACLAVWPVCAETTVKEFWYGLYKLPAFKRLSLGIEIRLQVNHTSPSSDERSTVFSPSAFDVNFRMWAHVG